MRPRGSPTAGWSRSTGRAGSSASCDRRASRTPARPGDARGGERRRPGATQLDDARRRAAEPDGRVRGRRGDGLVARDALPRRGDDRAARQRQPGRPVRPATGLPRRRRRLRAVVAAGRHGDRRSPILAVARDPPGAERCAHLDDLDRPGPGHRPGRPPRARRSGCSTCSSRPARRSARSSAACWSAPSAGGRCSSSPSRSRSSRRSRSGWSSGPGTGDVDPAARSADATPGHRHPGPRPAGGGPHRVPGRDPRARRWRTGAARRDRGHPAGDPVRPVRARRRASGGGPATVRQPAVHGGGPRRARHDRRPARRVHPRAAARRDGCRTGRPRRPGSSCSGSPGSAPSPRRSAGACPIASGGDARSSPVRCA